ncbi:MAG: acyltransferase [Rhodoferax sp.]
MRSTTGEHFPALDHVRAVAAYMVFCWHFLHGLHGSPVPFNQVLWAFPLALLDEGHTGVALFMVLSGYLFAKLLEGRQIDFKGFLWNRALRLLPLLGVIMIINAVWVVWRGESLSDYGGSLLKGLFWPTWPNGGWSITVELHFYVLLPGLLWAIRRDPRTVGLILLAMLALRTGIFMVRGEVHYAAYGSLLGRLDQFVLGIAFFHHRAAVLRYRPWAWVVLLGFALFWAWFDHTGGFFMRPSFPSPSALWVVIPTLEALAYATLIVVYDHAYRPSGAWWDRLLQRLGAYSYGIYLWHFFWVFPLATWIHSQVLEMGSIYRALPVATVCFVAMLGPAWLSYRFIEKPFLRFRRRYAR